MDSPFKQLQTPFENYLINKEGTIKNTLRNNRFNRFWINKTGYKIYTLWNYKTKKKKHFSLHRLLGIAFIDNPFNLPVIDHMDRNPLNNNIENLRWCDYSENCVNKLNKNPLGRGILKSKNGKRFVVAFFRNNQKIYVGTYDTIQEAKNGRTEALKKYYENKSIKILPITSQSESES
tara:strand:- start:316 stop:846 length:531 start_codon:yes stop_codon:yes gene_type:complete